jgi:hypothetical protein
VDGSSAKPPEILTMKSMKDIKRFPPWLKAVGLGKEEFLEADAR